jgi:SOS response regulatory protein OraA/RecX
LFDSELGAVWFRKTKLSSFALSGALQELKESERATACEVWRKEFGVLPQDQKEKARQMRFL